MIIWSVYLYVFCRLRTAIFVPRGKRSDWIFINVFFFLLIYRKRKFCAEPMRERLTFHFGLGTRSVNFRFFFLFFFSFFLFFQIKARSRLVTLIFTVKQYKILYVHIYMCAHVHACLFVYVRVYSYVHMYMYIFVSVCIHVCVEFLSLSDWNNYMFFCVCCIPS